MKKSIAIAISLAAISGVTSAQSSVTLYGLIDLSIRQVKNGSVGSLVSQANGGATFSHWGLKGSEDLGGGLSAQFQMEADILADTGLSATPFWNRRSTIGLRHKDFGEFRMGRDIVPTHIASCSLDPFGCTGIAGGVNFRSNQAAVFSGMGGNALAFRANNSVSYFTPENMGGFFAHLMLSIGEGELARGTEQAESFGMRLGYNSGPVSIQVATRKVTNATATISDFNDNVVGASYDFGPLTVALQQRSFKFGADDVATQSSGWIRINPCFLPECKSKKS
jgi:predicted porin